MTEQTNNTTGANANESQKERPGRLMAENFLTIETRLAQQMYTGRAKTADKDQVVGFNHFGALMTRICDRAALDDPYMDMYLIEVEQEIEQALLTLQELHEKLVELLNHNKKLQINVPESVKPLKVRLSFRSPYAYKAADLIMVFDEAAKLLNAGRHTARINNDQFHNMRGRLGKAVRRVFHTPTRFPIKHIQISREEYRQRTRKALEIIQQYGEVPEDILSGKRRGQYAPPIKHQGFFVKQRKTLTKAQLAKPN